MNTLTETQKLRFILLRSAQYDTKKAAEAYDFIVGSESSTKEPEARQEPKDGVYLVFPDETVFYQGQEVPVDVAAECIGVGVKLGSKSLMVALHDCVSGKEITLTTKEGGSRFVKNYHTAAEGWQGETNTKLLQDLNPEIKLEAGQYIPSLGQLYFILTHFSKINDALEAVGGDPLESDWYWSSTEYSATGAWYLYLNDGGANGNTKATTQYRVRPVSAFLL